MIFECPQCHTAHSKPEVDVAGGRLVKCRRCGHNFSVTPSTATPNPKGAPAAATTPAPPANKSDLFGAQDLKEMLGAIGGKAPAPRPITQPPAFVAAPTAPPVSGSVPVVDTTGIRALPLPPFPGQVLQTYLRGVWRWLSAKPIGIRAVFLAPLGLVPAGVVALIFLTAGGPEARVGFLDERRGLSAGPGDDSLYVKVAQLERGDEVLVFPGSAVGDYLMVRDVMGRAGFLPKDLISPHRPASMPSQPFAGCRQSPIEKRVDACRARAEAQLKSCRHICTADDNETACLEHCQRRFAACARGCAGQAAEAAPELRSEEPAATDDESAANEKKKRPFKKVGKKKKR